MKNDINIKKIIVFHPMKQHSYKTAEALAKNGMLYQYCTSIYYNPKSFLYKFLSIFLGEKNMEKMLSRNSDILTPYVKTYSTLLGLIFLLVERLDKNSNDKYITKMQYLLTKNIGKKVAKVAIKNKVDIIITYDTWSYGLIKELRKRKSNIKIVLDYSSLYAEEILNILQTDININKNINRNMYDRSLSAFKPNLINLYRYEKDNSDFFLSPSSVVDKSLIKYGVDTKKIYRCTYGTNFNRVLLKKKSNKQITFIYVGRLSYAKGVHYLINAFNKIYREDVKLILVGNDIDNMSKFVKSKNIEIIGEVQHSKLFKLLEKSDVIISASLYDSFSIALLEGASYNLPIICTYNVGVSDYIVDGKNGFVIKIQDSEEIKKKVEYILNNKNEMLYKMSKESGKITDKLTWDNYYKNIQYSLVKICKI